MWNKKALYGFILLFLGLGIFTLFSVPAHATGGINPEISFEGKIVDNSGINIADGTYNMEFKIYSGPSSIGTGDTLLFTEDWLVGSTQGGVALSSGTYEVNLGSAGAGDSVALSSLNWNQYPLWLSLQVGNTSSCTIITNFHTNCGGDTEMTPYIQFTSTPYSFQANQIGYTNSGFVGTLSFNSTLSGTDNVTIPDASGTICLQNATTCGFAASTGGTGYIQNQNSAVQTTAVFKISGTGQASAFDASSAANLNVGTSTASSVTIGQAVSTSTVTVNNAFTVTGVTPASGNAATVLSVTGGAGAGTASAGNGAAISLQSGNGGSGSTDNGDAGNITLSAGAAGSGAGTAGVAGSVIVKNQANSNTAFQIQNAAGTSTIFNVDTTSGGTVSISALTAPISDILSISNSGNAVTTTNANGLGVNYVGGSAAVTGSGIRIDYTPGGTSGGIWSGLNIVANTSGAVTGVHSYGIDLTGPTSLNGGTNTAVEVATGWNIGVDIQSGGIQLAAQSDPASPAASNLSIYAKSVAGLVIPEWLSPTDQNTPFQPGLGFNRVAYSEPNGVANCTSGSTGFGSTSVGGTTCTAPAPSSTSLYTSVRLENFSTGTTAGTVNYQKQDVLQVWRGNAAGLGGYFYTMRFGLNTLQSGNRAFVGLADSVGTPTNVDPTTNTTPGKLGMAINANSGDWNFVNNITGTAPTVTNLGSSFPVNTTDLFELIIYCPEDGSTITYRITDETTGVQTTGSISTNIPAATTFMAPLLWITNNATAAAAILSFNGWYLQSDN